VTAALPGRAWLRSAQGIGIRLPPECELGDKPSGDMAAALTAADAGICSGAGVRHPGAGLSGQPAGSWSGSHRGTGLSACPVAPGRRRTEGDHPPDTTPAAAGKTAGPARDVSVTMYGECITERYLKWTEADRMASTGYARCPTLAQDLTAQCQAVLGGVINEYGRAAKSPGHGR
jgi:hypothetical protein